MMSEMGVSGLKIQEVLGLDNGLLAILPYVVHGLSSLFHAHVTQGNPSMP